MRPPLVTPRIIGALALQPMTVQQVARCISVRSKKVYLRMHELAKQGAIEPCGSIRVSRRGGPRPLLWRVASARVQ